MKYSTFTLLSFLLILLFNSCDYTHPDVSYTVYNEEDSEILYKYLNLPVNKPLQYNTTFPDYLGLPMLRIDNELATLGRVLFFDKNLSSDNSISCASCHKQELGFSDNIVFSHGAEGQTTDRNSLALGSVFNFRQYYGPVSNGMVPFFWDNRAESVSEQSSQTFANPREMNLTLIEVYDRVKAQEYYPPLFKAAYDDQIITVPKILNAINEYVNSIANVNTKFDREMNRHFNSVNSETDIGSIDFEGFTLLENTGKKIYADLCSSCHGRFMERPIKIKANNGLDLEYEDNGIGAINHLIVDKGLFKVPTLRNIELTGPYMHDGRFETLEEVIDHYSDNIQAHPNLSVELKDTLLNEPLQFNFNENKKQALISFLKTLTDEKSLTAEKYSDPFKR